MHIKKGDTVQLMKGKEASAARGSAKRARGTVSEILVDQERVRVEGLRTVIKHMKKGRSQKNPEGGRIEILGSIALANLQLVCPKCDKPTRVGKVAVDLGGDKGFKNVRICRKCEKRIDA